MFLPDPAPCGQLCHNAAPRGLTAAERGVVLLARGDAARFGWEADIPRTRAASTARRLFAALTGIASVPALADPRLERLRLFACMMRRGDRRADGMAEALRIDGFGEAALHEAVRLALG